MCLLAVTPHSEMCVCVCVVCILKCMFAYAECIFVCIAVVNRMDLITANHTYRPQAGKVIHTDLE